MPLMLDEMRAEFAHKLAEDPAARFSMDKALAHVVTLAYQKGMEEGIATGRDASPMCDRGTFIVGMENCNEQEA